MDWQGLWGRQELAHGDPLWQHPLWPTSPWGKHNPHAGPCLKPAGVQAAPLASIPAEKGLATDLLLHAGGCHRAARKNAGVRSCSSL